MLQDRIIRFSPTRQWWVVSSISHLCSVGCKLVTVMPRILSLCSQHDWVGLRLDEDPEIIVPTVSSLLILLQCFASLFLSFSRYTTL